MYAKLLILLIAVSSFKLCLGDEPRRAIVFLDGTYSNNRVYGSITFSEISGGLRLSGTINGMPQGRYGFHIHEIGDISHCDNTGGHFDPHGNVHGGQDHEIRHVGDLGNVEFDVNRVSNVDIDEPLMSLRGENSILGRALVLHVQEDDLGQGGHPDSLTTGNAGPRAACGVVGILSPVTPWNSAALASPSFLLMLVAALVLKLRF